MSCWETDIYSKGKQLNKYPYDSIVSFIFSNYGYLSKEERKNINILEVGCGAGNNIWFLSEEGFNTYGIDISPSAIKFCNNNLKDKNLKATINIGTFSKLPYKDNFFDIIIDRLAISHDPEEINNTLMEVKRVLKPNGKFMSTMFSTDDDGYKLRENIINNNGCLEVKDGYLKDLGPVYFLDDELSIIRKYFNIINKEKNIKIIKNNYKMCNITFIASK